MLIQNGRLRLMLLSAVSALAIAGASQLAVAQSASEGQMSKRQWPSQQQPKLPATARVCSCLYDGQNVPIGKSVCMKYRGKLVMAKCESIVNNPSWAISKDACPHS